MDKDDINTVELYIRTVDSNDLKMFTKRDLAHRLRTAQVWGYDVEEARSLILEAVKEWEKDD